MFSRKCRCRAEITAWAIYGCRAKIKKLSQHGNNHGPCLEVETMRGKANGSEVANRCLNQQENESIEI